MAANRITVSCATQAVTATPKSILGVKAAANIALRAWKIAVSCDGVDATKGPALIEICSCTFATNGPGTNSTSVTPAKEDTGRDETVQCTAARAWSAEPTVLTVAGQFNVPTFNGVVIATLNNIIPGGAGLVVRVTLPSGVTNNCSITLWLEE